jgi:DNA-binding XRE family transcriptional regulator
MNDAITAEMAAEEFSNNFATLPNPQALSGKVLLNCTLLRQLRLHRLLSQQDLANDCWRRNIQLSIATIKRAELGHAVRFRIAHELARCFNVPVQQIVQA